MEKILIIAALLLCVICAFKESKLTGTYKTLGIFGRVKAYLAMDFTFAGLFLLVSSIIALIAPNNELAQQLGEGGAVMIPVAAVITAIGVLLYINAFKKCPPPLRKRVIFDMIAVGLGVTMKLTIFFIFSIWKTFGPKIYTDESGKSYFVYMDGEVYDAGNGRYGKLHTNSDGSQYVEFKKTY